MKIKSFYEFQRLLPHPPSLPKCKNDGCEFYNGPSHRRLNQTSGDM